jgi:prephenate dehydrogenase
MGGSFALALKRAGLVRRVIGFSPSPATRERALDMGVIDAVALSPDQAAHGSDLVLVAVPVAATQYTLATLVGALSPSALLMDVGSTKRDVVQAARLALGDKLATFVPAHPIAGKEAAGVAHADVDLYTGCQVILTPTEHTGTTQLAQAQALWAALGAQVRIISALDHDSAFAAVSHLPHMLAFAAMNAINAQDQGAQYLSLAGPGFRDFTRIAASDPAVWRDILNANRDQLLLQSQYLREALQAFENALAQDDSAALQALITAASQSRAAWSLKR